MVNQLSDDAPFYRALMRHSGNAISNFHSLPIGNFQALKISRYQQEYRKLLACKASTEVTYTAPFLDSLAFPTGVLADAQAQASTTFGSDQTLFVTTGSTASNNIAVSACCSNGERTIMQKGLHQSFHFSLMEMGQNPEYVCDTELCSTTGATGLDLPQLLQRLDEEEKKKNPFKVAIFNAQSYDGVIHDLNRIFACMLEVAPSLSTIIIDEAWGAWTCFDRDLSVNSALSAARKFSSRHNINFVVTHSAHKSLFTLRQGSFLHCIGTKEIQEKLKNAHYRIHTTSPSYSILASLDLTCTQMREEGQVFASRSLHLAQVLRSSIDTKLSRFSVVQSFMDKGIQTPCIQDSTKVWISTSQSELSGEALRTILFNEFNIYICRYSERAILVNVNFGITKKDICALVTALQCIESSLTKKTCTNLVKESVSSKYIIPYPPGVPLIVPGDIITESMIRKVGDVSAAGVAILQIEKLSSQGALP